MQHKSMTVDEITEAQEDAFRSFLDSQQTKFMLSLIPEGAPPDAVVTLVRSAFNAGFGAGAGTFVADLAKSLLSRGAKGGEGK